MLLEPLLTIQHIKDAHCDADERIAKQEWRYKKPMLVFIISFATSL